jgi:hypothetical protein
MRMFTPSRPSMSFARACVGAWWIGLRAACRHPRLVVTSALVIGIGLATCALTLESLGNRLVLPLSRDVARSLVGVGMVSREHPDDLRQLSLPSLEDLRGTGAFRHIVAVSPREAMMRVRDGLPMRIDLEGVEGPLAEVFGAQMLRGRQVQPLDRDAAVISERLWRGAAFGGRWPLDADVEIDGRRRQIVGVIPEAVRAWRRQADVWIPLRDMYGPEVSSGRGYLIGLAAATLANGVSVTAAHEQVAGLRLPEMRDVDRLAVVGARDLVTTPAERIVGGLALLIVASMLFVCFLNVATMALGDVATDLRSLGVRRALGSRAAFELAHGLGAGALHALVGVAAAGGLVTVVFALSRPIGLAPVFPAIAAGRLLVATLSAAVALGQMRVAFHRLAAPHRAGGDRESSFAVGRQWLRLCSLAQLACAAALAVIALSAATTAWSLRTAEIGVHAEGVMLARVRPSAADPVSLRTALPMLAARMGVPFAASTSLPVLSPRHTTSMNAQGHGRVLNSASDATPHVSFVTDAFFEVLEVPVMTGAIPKGAAWDESAIVVNQAFVDAWWPGEEAVGKSLAVGGRTEEPRRVAAVVGNVVHEAVGAQPRPEAYVPLRLDAVEGTIHLLGRPTLPARDLLFQIEQTMRDASARVSVTFVGQFHDELQRTYASTSLLAVTAVLSAAAAVFLSVTGVMGAAVLHANARRRELAVRLALGQTPVGLLWSDSRRSGVGVLLAVGIGAGLVLLGFEHFQTAFAGIQRPLETPTALLAAALVLLGWATVCLPLLLTLTSPLHRELAE